MVLPTRVRKRTGQRQGKIAEPNPKLVVSDNGHAERLRLHAKAPQGWIAINKSYTVTWLRHRMREYVNVHGYASSGVCALLERAAEQYADCDWLRANAAANGATAAELKQAAQHAQLARSHELAAYELAAREGVAWRSQQDAGIKQHRTLAKSLLSEVTNSEPDEWGGIDGKAVDAWGKPDPGEVIPTPDAPMFSGSDVTHGSTATQCVGVGGGANSDRVPPASPPGGVDWLGTPLPPDASKTDSSLLPISATTEPTEPE